MGGGEISEISIRNPKCCGQVHRCFTLIISMPLGRRYRGCNLIVLQLIVHRLYISAINGSGNNTFSGLNGKTTNYVPSPPSNVRFLRYINFLCNQVIYKLIYEYIFQSPDYLDRFANSGIKGDKRSVASTLFSTLLFHGCLVGKCPSSRSADLTFQESKDKLNDFILDHLARDSPFSRRVLIF